MNFDDPPVTLALLKANAVVGVTGFFSKDGKTLQSIGIQCALCHSTVDDSLKPGIGLRLDGWPNRDLNIGAIVASAPDLNAYVEMLQVDAANAASTTFRPSGPQTEAIALLRCGRLASATLAFEASSTSVVI